MLFKCLVEFVYGMVLDMYIQKLYGMITLAHILLSPFARFSASQKHEMDLQGVPGQT